MAWQFGFDAWIAAAGIGSVMGWVCGNPEESRERLQLSQSTPFALDTRRALCWLYSIAAF